MTAQKQGSVPDAFGRCHACLTAWRDCRGGCCNACIHTTDPALEPEPTW